MSPDAGGRPAGAGARFLDFMALTGFMVAQPVFAVLSGSTDYLLFRQVGRVPLLVLVLVTVVVPPVALWLLEGVGRRLFPGSATLVHTVLVGALFFVLGVQLVSTVASFGRAGRVVTGVVVGALLTALYRWWRPARMWVRWAWPAPVIFAALFLFTSPVVDLLRDAGPPAVADSVGSASPVVLVVFDEFPAVTLLDGDGRIDKRFFPNFATLAAEATHFRNATSVAARTVHAVPAMLTGRYPREDAVPTTGNHPDNLFTLLRSSHGVKAFESVTSMCPTATCPRDDWIRAGRWHVVGDALRIWMHTATGGSHGGEALGAWFHEDTVDMGPRPERFERFLASIDGDDTPFHFLHLVLPHAPWRYLPDGLRYTPRDLGMVSYEERIEHPWPALVDHRRHVSQAMYVDRLLGETVERLKDVGLYDRATLLVTADHGVSFQPGLEQGTRNLRPSNEHEVAWIPFLLKVPGQEVGAVSDRNVMSVDVAPTVAELAGTRLPWPADGVSLVSAPPRSSAKVWFNEPGRPLNVDTAAFGRVLDGATAELAPSSEGAEALFRVGPLGGLVGTPAGSHPTVEGRRPVGRVDDLASHYAVDAGTGTVPSLVSGYLDLSGQSWRPQALAIALNGVIAGVSEVYADGDRLHRFAALVPPRRFVQGRNLVELFLVVDARDGPALQPVEVRAA